MKIVFISDTHGKHKQLKNLPYGDMIIHSGDFTTIGEEYEIRNFFKWYGNLNQYKYKIIIAGNHDWLFERNRQLALSYVPDNVTYLEDSGINIEGINFYGSPVQKPFYDWAFNRPEEKLAVHWAAIPNNTDVIITHSPPYGIFDWSVYDKIHTGSPSLYKEIIERIKPKISVFGHIHSGHGITKIDDTIFINASNLDEKYQYSYEPIVVEI